MAKEKSIKLNFIMNAILTMSGFIFPLITFPYASRVLLPVGTGKVSFATSIIAYFAMFAQLGIPTYGIRACAKVRDDKEKLSHTVQEILIINFIMTCLSYAVFFVALFAVPRMRMEKELFLVIGSTLLFNMIGMEWLYKALEEYTYITIRSIAFKFIGLIVMFLTVQTQEDYVFYGLITIFSTVGSNVFNFINVHKYVSFKPFKHYNLKPHIKPILVFFAMAVATTVYTNLDVVMLGFMQSDTDVGYYNAAVRIKDILVSIVTSLGAVLLPRLVYFLEQGKTEEFHRVSRKAIHFVAVVATPMMLYFMLFAREGIYFLSGEAYAGSILPMQIIMPVLLFIGMSNILGIQILVPMGKEKIVLYSVISGAVVDLVVNMILIPHLGASGAAIGTLIAEFVVWMYQLANLKDLVLDAYKKISYGKIGFALLVATLLSIWMKNLVIVDSVVWNCFFILLFSAVSFFLVYFVLLYLLKEKFIRDIVNDILAKVRKKVGN